MSLFTNCFLVPFTPTDTTLTDTDLRGLFANRDDVNAIIHHFRTMSTQSVHLMPWLWGVSIDKVQLPISEEDVLFHYVTTLHKLNHNTHLFTGTDINGESYNQLTGRSKSYSGSTFLHTDMVRETVVLMEGNGMWIFRAVTKQSHVGLVFRMFDTFEEATEFELPESMQAQFKPYV
jgi:hypothetical protein